MPRHFNPSLTEDVARTFNSKTGDNIGSEIGDTLVPVVPILRICNIVRRNGATTTGSSTIFTTPADKDFYLVSATAAAQADSTCDAATAAAQLRVIIDGATQNLISLARLTLTAYTGSITQTFPFPIKLDRNTTIIITNTFTVGACQKEGTIVGYTVEVTK